MTELDGLIYAETNKYLVEEFSSPLKSFSVSLNGTYAIAVNHALLGPAEGKTALFHELGHCATGSFYNQNSPCDVRRRHENRADKWAIQKLIPEDALDEAVAEGHTELWDLAEHFGVTEDFMRKAVCWYTHGNLAADLYF